MFVRFGFFACFVALIATGFYAHSLQGRLEAAHASAQAAAAQSEKTKTDLEMKNQTDATALKSCEEREADVKKRLEEATAALTQRSSSKTRKGK